MNILNALWRFFYVTLLSAILLLPTALSAASDVEEIQYNAYLAMVNGDAERDEGSTQVATQFYKDSIGYYKELQKIDPSFKPESVLYRITYCQNQILKLTGALPTPERPLANNTSTEEITALKEQVKNLQQRLSVSEEKKITSIAKPRNDERIEALTKEKKTLQRKNAALEKVAEQAMADLGILHEKNNLLEKTASQITSDLDALRKKKSDLQTSSKQDTLIDTLTAKLQKLEKDTQQQHAMKAEEVRLALSQNKQQEQQIQELRNKLKEIRQEAQKQEQIGETHAHLAISEKAFKKELSEISSAANLREKELQNELRLSRAETASTSSELTRRLKKSTDALASLQGNIEQMERSMSASQASTKEAEQTLSLSRKKEQTKNEQLKESRSEIARLQTQLLKQSASSDREQRTMVAALEERLAALSKENKNLHNDLKKSVSSKDLSAAKKQSDKTIKSLQKKTDALTTKLQKTSNELKLFRDKNVLLLADAKQSEQVDGLKQQIKKMTQKTQEEQHDLLKKQTRLMASEKELQQEVALLKEEVRSQENTWQQKMNAAQAEVDAISSKMKRRLQKNQGTTAALQGQLDRMEHSMESALEDAQLAKKALALHRTKSETEKGQLLRSQQVEIDRLTNAINLTNRSEKERAKKIALHNQTAHEAALEKLNQENASKLDALNSLLKQTRKETSDAKESTRIAQSKMNLLEEEVSKIRSTKKTELLDTNKLNRELKGKLNLTMEELLSEKTIQETLNAELSKATQKNASYIEKLTFSKKELDAYKKRSSEQNKLRDEQLQEALEQMTSTIQENKALKESIAQSKNTPHISTQQFAAVKTALQETKIALNLERAESLKAKEQSQTTQAKLSQMTQTAEIQMQKLDKLTSDNKRLVGGALAQSKKLEAYAIQMPKIQQELVKPLHEKIAKQTTRIETLSQLLKKQKDDKKAQTKTFAKLFKEKSRALKELQEHEKLITARATKAEQTLETQNKLLTQANETAAQYTAYFDEFKEAKALIQKYADTANQWKKAFAELQKEVESKEDINKTLHIQIRELTEVQNDMRSQSVTNLDAIKESMAQLKVVNEEKQNLVTQLQKAAVATQTLQNTKDIEQQKIHQQQEKLDALTDELTTLSNKLTTSDTKNVSLHRQITEKDQVQEQLVSARKTAEKKSKYLALQVKNAQTELTKIRRQQLNLIRQVKILLNDGEVPDEQIDAKEASENK